MMSRSRQEIVVLGGGAVGTAIALHLRLRGRDVTLVERHPATRETSFGNAGLIQREGVRPYAFPRELRAILRAASNRTASVHYHPRDLWRFAPFLFRYWQHSRPDRHDAISRHYATLIGHCLDETRALAAEAGVEDLLRPGGWISAYRTAAGFEAEVRESEATRREFGIGFRPLDRAGLAEAEPHLDPTLAGGVHFTDPDAVSDPGALVDAWRARFVALGSTVTVAEAGLPEEEPGGWRVPTSAGPLSAGAVVVALGPWAGAMAARLGYRLVLGVKRGYHMHYRPAGNALLHRPVLDAEGGYMLAPMRAGIRLTTGAEFARPEAPPTPVQLERVEPVARTLFPLADRVDPRPWMGARPCTPDMMPVIGPAPRHRGLFFAFGHAHHGLTLSATTGRLVADLVTGEMPFVDPMPFRVDRPGIAA